MRTDGLTDGPTRKRILRTPFQGFKMFSFDLSSRIGPKFNEHCNYFCLTRSMLISSITISGQFPGESGLVAPGMSCKYDIRFAPDSLKDYDDQISVMTQASEPLIVPLRARRKPPCLTCKPFYIIYNCSYVLCQSFLYETSK